MGSQGGGVNTHSSMVFFSPTLKPSVCSAWRSSCGCVSRQISLGVQPNFEGPRFHIADPGYLGGQFLTLLAMVSNTSFEGVPERRVTHLHVGFGDVSAPVFDLPHVPDLLLTPW